MNREKLKRLAVVLCPDVVDEDISQRMEEVSLYSRSNLDYYPSFHQQ